MIKCRSIPAWLVTLALMLNTIGPAGLVLCIGDDGHLAFEATCFETPEEVDCCDAGHHDEEPGLVADDHCGDCTDLPLLSNPLRPRGSDMSLPVATGPIWLPAICFEPIAYHAPKLSASPPGCRALGPPGWLRDAGTIILRL